MSSNKKIIVIGAGWSGLYAAKWFIEEGLKDVIVLEKTNDVGGIWVYRENHPGGCYLKTRTTASKAYLHASDFPFSEEVGHFPDHRDVLKFLNDYADHFKLRDYIQFKTHVHKVRKTKDGKWKVVSFVGADLNEDPRVVGKKQINYYDIVAVCSGQHQVPFSPIEDEPYKHYKGEVSHAHFYKHPTPDMAEKSVLVVGGGESASDVAAEVCEVAPVTYMSIRQGVWFQDRTVGAHQPADMVFTKHQRLLGLSDFQSWLIWLGRYIMLELMWGKGGSGVDVWQPHCKYFHGFLNKSRDVIDKVALGKVQPRGAAVKVDGKCIWFKGRKEPDVVDLIIFATGYRPNVPFLKGNLIPSRAYKLVFNPHDPTLCFIGSPRPMIGSIPALGELQARWAAKVYSGQVSLPSSDEMIRILEADRLRHKRVFPQDDHSLPHLVNHWEYSDEIGAMFGAKPDLVRWFFRNPFKWWMIISAPWSAFLYHVNDPKRRDEALKNIEKHTWLPNHFSFHAMNVVVLFMDLCLVCIALGVLCVLLKIIF